MRTSRTVLTFAAIGLAVVVLCLVAVRISSHYSPSVDILGSCLLLPHYFPCHLRRRFDRGLCEAVNRRVVRKKGESSCAWSREICAPAENHAGPSLDVLGFGLRPISLDTGVTGIEYPIRPDQLHQAHPLKIIMRSNLESRQGKDNACLR